MILRRIAEAFRRQDWFTVFVETMIVVLGVFLGLQVNNWNAARANARLGRDYVERLAVDLSRDLAAVQKQTGYYEEVLRAVVTTDRLLRDPDADPEALVISAYRASEIMFTAPAHATWDQIVSSGHLGLLPNDAIVDHLSNYYSFDIVGDAYRILSESDYRRTARRIIPIAIQAAMRDGCSDNRDANQAILGFAETCALNADPSIIREAAAALRAEPAPAAALRYQYSDVITSRLNLLYVESVIARALGELGVPEEETPK